MFYVYIIQDKINIQPSDLNEKLDATIKRIINAKYASKILENEGYCISLLQYKMIENTILQLEGTIDIHVELEMLMFKPSKEESFTGKIVHNYDTGILIDIGFMDVFIPSHMLMHTSCLDDGIWAWKYMDDDKKVHHMFFDNGQVIRLRVMETNFSKSPFNIKTSEGFVKVHVLGSCLKEGEGLVAWWKK
jgi:DNA-directed RNA polymerase subunit E'/Rpb7